MPGEVKRKRQRQQLNLKLIPREEVIKEWKGVGDKFLPQDRFLFIRCTQLGKINWDKTSVYDPTELVGRKIRIF